MEGCRFVRSQRWSLSATLTSGAWLPSSGTPLWGPAPLWAGMSLCEVEALEELDEAVDPDWDCVPCGEQAATPSARADREVTARMRRVLIMAPSYEVPRRSRTATPGSAQG